MVVDGLSFRGEWMDLLTFIVTGMPTRMDLVTSTLSFGLDLVRFVDSLKLDNLQNC